jgi:transcriptional regulator with XRE-family HTH domain
MLLFSAAMNSAQCRMARAGLGLSLKALGSLAGVRVMTISKFEAGGTIVAPTIEKLRACLAAQGVEFINGGKAIGVRVPRREEG